uniref:Uncharacterized protein n=1 Tax=Arundo donax TaxID=35708 RepID=A0A0A8ZEY9_ARUDO
MWSLAMQKFLQVQISLKTGNSSSRGCITARRAEENM